MLINKKNLLYDHVVFVVPGVQVELVHGGVCLLPGEIGHGVPAVPPQLVQVCNHVIPALPRRLGCPVICIIIIWGS